MLQFMVKTITPKSRKQWCAWLQKNHAKEQKVWLIKYKRHTGKPAMSHRESMEEAICFGWIDTIVKRLDENRYLNCFVRRTKKSNWSTATQNYAKEMIKQGKMTPAGLQAYKDGLQRPVIGHNLPRNPNTPKDLKQALQQDKKAQENFKKFAPSYSRLWIYWIEKAKRAETRQRRIREVVQRAHDNKRKWS